MNKENSFLEELAEIILYFIKSDRYPKMERDIVNNGNFNRRTFQSTNMFRQNSRNWIRFMMNMAMVMTPNDFRKLWQALGQRILEAADTDECDMINNEHFIILNNGEQ